jgi:hypothetical protein
MRVCFKVFQSMTQSWDDLFGDAARFATDLGRDRLICISHSHEEHVGVVTVWYWSDGKK